MLRRYNFYVIPRGCSDFFYAFCFWYCFTPLSGYFSPFPHGTGPLSVIREYLGLSGGPDRFTRDFSGPVLLGILHQAVHNISVTGLTPSLAGLSRPFTYACTTHLLSPAELKREVPQPRPCNARRLSHMERFSLIRVRSPLLTESLLFSLPAGTEMFHFPAFPPRTLCVQMRVTRQLAPLAGFPHSDTLGSQSGYRLPQAYRRFLRPSSAPNAKASTVCS